MRIALAIMNYYEHGITRRDFKRLAEELCRRGHQLTIYYRSWRAEKHIRAEYVQITTHRFSTVGRLRSFGRQVRALIKKNPVDCFVSFSRIPGADIYYLGEHSCSDSLRRHYGWLRIFNPNYLAVRSLEKDLFVRSKKTRIFALTKMQIERVMKSFDIPESRFDLLPVGVSKHLIPADNVARSELRHRVRQKLNIGDNEFFLLQFGPGFRSKGVDRSIAALGNFQDDELFNTRLVVSGSGSVAKMDALARSLQVRNNVMFIGDRERESNLLVAADILVHPARNASLDSIPLEALAAGLPVVCSGDYGFAEFISENGGIVLPQPFSCLEFSRVLRVLVKTPEKVAEMRQAAEAFDPASLDKRIPYVADRIEEFCKK